MCLTGGKKAKKPEDGVIRTDSCMSLLSCGAAKKIYCKIYVIISMYIYLYVPPLNCEAVKIICEFPVSILNTWFGFFSLLFQVDSPVIPRVVDHYTSIVEAEI